MQVSGLNLELLCLMHLAYHLFWEWLGAHLGGGALGPMEGGAGKKSLGSLGDLLSQARLGGGTGCGEDNICHLFFWGFEV